MREPVSDVTLAFVNSKSLVKIFQQENSDDSHLVASQVT